MQDAFRAALAHAPPAPEVLSVYANYAINVLHDPALALSLVRESVKLAPGNPAYRRNLDALLKNNGGVQDAGSPPR
jgi:hypothetical protein